MKRTLLHRLRAGAAVVAGALVLGSMPTLPVSAAEPAVPQAPVLSIIAKDEVLPFTLEGGGTVEVAVLRDGQDPAGAVWTARSTLPLAEYHGSVIRVLARAAGVTDPSLWFDATYDVRTSYPPGFGRGTETDPDVSVAATSPAILSWPAAVADYTPGTNVNVGFQTPQTVVGKTGLVVLGDNGSITLEFDRPIGNGAGADFVVIENGLRVGNLDFVELGRISVSSNGTDFVTFDSASRWPTPVGGFAGMAATDLGGLGGRDLAGRGTPFDLTALTNKPLVRSGAVDLDAIGFVRIDDIKGNGTQLDSFGRPIFDPDPTAGSAGFDLVGVGALHLAPRRSTDPAADVCTDGGVSVLVDFGPLAGDSATPFVASCVEKPGLTALQVLQASGATVDVQDGIVCAVDGLPATCAEGRWTSWTSTPGGHWTAGGSTDRVPADGAVEGWRFVVDTSVPPAAGPSFVEGVDTTAPALTVTAQPGSTGTSTVSFTVDDPGAAVTCELDGSEIPCGAAVDGVRTLVLENLAVGPHTLTLQAADLWSNRTVEKIEFEVTAAPVVPATPVITDLTDTGFTVGWSFVPGPVERTVHVEYTPIAATARAAVPTAGRTESVVVPAGTELASGTFAVTGLVAETAYLVRVVVTGPDGEVDSSTTVTTRAAVDPGAPGTGEPSSPGQTAAPGEPSSTGESAAPGGTEQAGDLGGTSSVATNLSGSTTTTTAGSGTQTESHRSGAALAQTGAAAGSGALIAAAALLIGGFVLLWGSRRRGAHLG